MKLWRGQPDNWMPLPLSRGRHIAIGLCFAAIFLYFAVESFVYQSPCRARSFTCMAAASWASIFELPMGTAMAHIWLLFALIFGAIAVVAAPPRR
jgi:hypothetical protein